MINSSSSFSGKSARFAKLPGYEPNSWAIYGDDGSSISLERTNPQFSQSFGSTAFDFVMLPSLNLSLAGDIIGCGVDFTTYKTFFTRNGTLIGIKHALVIVTALIRPSCRTGLRECWP